MSRLGTSAVFFMVIAALVIFPGIGSAQVLRGWDFSVAAFGGSAFGSDYDGINVHNSASFGGKLQAWNTMARSRTRLDFGIELDATQFWPDVSSTGVISDGTGVTAVPGGTGRVGPGLAPSTKQDVSATIAAVNLLARFPIGAIDELPNGRWHPYVGVGGGVEVAHVTRHGSLTDPTDTDVAPVFQALTGMKFFMTRHVAFFAEYKFTHAKHSFTFVDPTVIFNNTPFGLRLVGEDLTFNTHHVVGGIAIHF